jgi:hypothetical protein
MAIEKIKSALTLTLSPRRGNERSPALVLRLTVRPILSLEFFRQQRTILPLPGGEGRGEGGRHHYFLIPKQPDGATNGR